MESNLSDNIKVRNSWKIVITPLDVSVRALDRIIMEKDLSTT